MGETRGVELTMFETDDCIEDCYGYTYIHIHIYIYMCIYIFKHFLFQMGT